MNGGDDVSAVDSPPGVNETPLGPRVLRIGLRVDGELGGFPGAKVSVDLGDVGAPAPPLGFGGFLELVFASCGGTDSMFTLAPVFCGPAFLLESGCFTGFDALALEALVVFFFGELALALVR